MGLIVHYNSIQKQALNPDPVKSVRGRTLYKSVCKLIQDDRYIQLDVKNRGINNQEVEKARSSMLYVHFWNGEFGRCLYLDLPESFFFRNIL